MKANILRWLGVVLILQTGVLHLLTAQGWFVAATYVGYLFVANFCATLLAAVGIYRQQAWGWLLGLIVALGSIAGYIWSRTLGLPGAVVEDWFSPYGVVALTAETLFILLSLLRPWKMVATRAIPARLHDFSPSLGLAVIVLVSFAASRWTAAVSTIIVDGHFHPGSVGELCRTQLTSFAELKKEYGVEIIQVAVTALDSIVDVRLKITDSDKAYDLISNRHAALLVDQQSLILPPHMHRHNKLRVGDVYFLFFPTQRNTVHPGSEVSLVFGAMRVEPITVK